MKRLKRMIRFEHKFEPRDLWIGLFWDRRSDGTHVYVCLVPAYVLHWVLVAPAPAQPERCEGCPAERSCERHERCLREAESDEAVYREQESEPERPRLPGWEWVSDTESRHPSGAEIRQHIEPGEWLWWRAPIVGSPSCTDPKLSAVQAAAAALGYEISADPCNPGCFRAKGNWLEASYWRDADALALSCLEHAERTRAKGGG